MTLRRALVSPAMSCRARTLPTTTGSTASKCDGFGWSEMCTSCPATSTSVLVPRWYFTSPDPCTSSGCALLPPNSLNTAVNGLRTMLTRVLSRPRCGIPMAISFTPAPAAVSIIACRAGMVTSPPSRPNRLVPT